MKNKKIVIAGGSGFIGKGLMEYFGDDNTVIVLTRQPKMAHEVYWDGTTTGEWVSSLEGADLLINLAGKSVNCRYTEANKAAIFSSRVNSTRVLGEAVKQLKTPPALWINAASATIYRHAEDRPMDEFSGEIEDDFSVQVCKRWEEAFHDIALPHTRKVVLRIAITLGRQGSVMIPYLNLVKFGLGGAQGSGRQYFSWIHITDVARMTEWLYEHPECSGTYNCSAPEPVTNKAFMRTLREETGMVFGLRAYPWMLRIGAALLGTEAELLLKSRWVVPTRITQAGFTFRYPVLREAVRNIVNDMPGRQYHLF